MEDVYKTSTRALSLITERTSDKYPMKTSSGNLKKRKKCAGIITTDEGLSRPKRPMSAYNYFFKSEHGRILDFNAKNSKKASFEEIARTIGARWKMVSAEELSKYEDMSKDDVERYKIEMSKFYDEQNARRRAKYFRSTIVDENEGREKEKDESILLNSQIGTEKPNIYAKNPSVFKKLHFEVDGFSNVSSSTSYKHPLLNSVFAPSTHDSPTLLASMLQFETPFSNSIQNTASVHELLSILLNKSNVPQMWNFNTGQSLLLAQIPGNYTPIFGSTQDRSSTVCASLLQLILSLQRSGT